MPRGRLSLQPAQAGFAAPLRDALSRGFSRQGHTVHQPLRRGLLQILAADILQSFEQLRIAGLLDIFERVV